jgi:cation transporter-like permease
MTDLALLSVPLYALLGVAVTYLLFHDDPLMPPELVLLSVVAWPLVALLVGYLHFRAWVTARCRSRGS